MADNTITIVGNLTKDPELRFTAAGKGVTSFGVAVNRRYQVNGEWREKVSFFNVVAWDALGENVAASLGKGNRVIISGRLDQREYATDDDRRGGRPKNRTRRPAGSREVRPRDAMIPAKKLRARKPR